MTTEARLEELMQRFTDVTGETTTYSKEIWCRSKGRVLDYSVHIFEGNQIKHVIRGVAIQAAVHWMHAYLESVNKR